MKRAVKISLIIAAPWDLPENASCHQQSLLLPIVIYGLSSKCSYILHQRRSHQRMRFPALDTLEQGDLIIASLHCLSEIWARVPQRKLALAASYMISFATRPPFWIS